MKNDLEQKRRRALLRLDWKLYAPMEYWPLIDAIKLVLGVYSDDDGSQIQPIRAEVRNLLSLVHHAKAAGQLSVKENKRGGIEVNAKQFIALVLKNGVELPPGFIEVVNPELALAEKEPVGPLFPMPEGKSFDDLTIKVLSDEFLEFSAPGAKPKGLTVAECELYSWKKKQLNRIGKFLLKLADNQGRTKGADLNQSQRDSLKTLATDIRKILRAVTGLTDDPFPYSTGDGYRLRCTLIKRTTIDEQDPPKSLLDQYLEE